MMKKVFISGLLCLLSCFAVWGGESATVTLTKSDDGKTLTITASGDITNYSGTFQDKSYSFNSTAVGKVFTLVSEGNYQSVADGNAFVSFSSYYKEIQVEKTKIENFISQTSYFSTSTAQSWTQKAIDEAYTYIRNNSVDKTNIKYWTNGEPKKVDGSTTITNDICVVSSDKDWDLRYWEKGSSDGGNSYYKSISEEDLSKYITTTTTYTALQTFYYSTDGGSTLTKVVYGQTFEYNESYEYYTVSSKYAPYDDAEKAAWVTDDNSGYVNTTTNSSEKKFVKMLRDNLAGVTKLLFKEETQGCGITIDNEIVKTILLPTENHEYNNPNTTIEELDLGSTTITNLTSDCFEVGYAAPHFNLAKLILPKTQIVDGRMVVPEGVISKFATNTNTKLTNVIIPKGYTKIGDKAFKDIVTVKEFSLPSTIKEIGTSAFENCSAMNDIALNVGLVTVGKRAFIGSGLNITPVFPSTLKNILAEAYSGLQNISELKFNQGLEFIGNCAFYSNSKIDDCQEVISFPSSIKYIGPGALSGRWFKDIYFYGEKAPLCPVGVLASNTSYAVSAFDDNIHMGNNGFKPAGSENIDLTYTADKIANGYANRMNYINHDYYLAMLHFPVGISEDNAKTYTDITRVYKTQRNTDGSFNATAEIVVGKEESVLKYNNTWSNNCLRFVNPGYEDTYLGNQYIWPSQTQWMRSFVCNSLGLEWDGVNTYRPTLSEEDVALMIKDELTIKYNNNSVQITDDNKGTYSDELRKIAYLGTRQFVFADGDHSEHTSYTIEVKGGQWWTLCVPFNMTKAEIDDVFGENTHVCLFSGVDRVGNVENNSITFKFQHDVYRHKTLKKDDGTYFEHFTNETSPCEDNDIVIYAHQAYMVYPTKTGKDVVFVVKDYAPLSGSPMPTIVKATDGIEYRFVGNYTTKIGGDSDNEVSTAAIVDVTIPQYSYMYAKRTGDANYQFWFYSGTNMNWKANKCVVQTTEKGGGEKDYTAFFVNPTNSAKQYSIFGMDMEDSEATGMENVTVIAGEQSEEVIYDICGRRISSPGKGLYIKNGKKYIKH